MMQQILKFKITCDGLHPRGGRCPCDLTLEGFSESDAFHYAVKCGWTWDLHTGWRCNASGGHQEKTGS